MQATSQDSVSIDTERAALLDAVRRSDEAIVRSWLDAASHENIVYIISGLEERQRADLLALLPPDEAAELVGFLPGSQALDALGSLEASVAADIHEELPSDERVDLVKLLGPGDAEEILAEVDHPVAADIRRLACYEEGTSGSLMLS